MGGRKVLVVGAHPDDEVLGVGGTIASHVANGDEVHLLIVTEGASQQYDDESMIEQKEQEARECAERLDVESIRFGRLPDMRLDQVDHVEVNRVIENAVGSVEPTVVYIHSNTDVNLDHRAVHESTAVATRPGSGVDEVLAYEVPSSTDWAGSGRRFDPTMYVDVTDHLETKVDAFLSYESERRKYPHPRSKEGIEARARSRGIEAGFEAAEAFSLVKSFRERP